MTTLKTLDSSIISLIILIFIYINAYNRSERMFMHYRLFMDLVRVNILMLIIDYLGWAFNGLPGSLNMFGNTVSNLFLYSLAPLPPMLWIIYTDFLVFKNEYRISKIKRVLVSLFVVNAFISVLSIYTGWFFSIDALNIYHRGNYFFVHVAFCYLLIIYAFLTVLLNRRFIEKRYYYSLLLFFLPMAVGTVLQVFFYGVSYNWSGMMLSLLIIYFNIQERGINTDYLTGVYNRRQLDGYINAKIRNCSENKTFSAVLIDINDFKSINDNFGHQAGDNALKEVADIIRRSLRRNDFVSRFGGDEFVIIMDIDDPMLLKQAIDRIQDGIKRYNESHERSYNISVSMGFSVYDIKSEMKAEEFLKHIDNLMFNDKKRNNSEKDLLMKQSEHKKDAGKSSFSRVDTEKLFQIIDLKPEDNFLDVGCGRGEYTLTAAKYLGTQGNLFAIDLWEDGVEILREEAQKSDINNLRAYVGDISLGLPIEDEKIDKCLMSAVLHGIKEAGKLEMTIQEIRRVLQTDGELIIIEWKKAEGPPGPGIMVRLIPEEIETLLKPFGFEQKTVQDVGEYFYVSIFVKSVLK